MRRFAAILALVSLVGLAQADIGPPPGIRRIPFEAKIVTEKAFPDYVFFAVSGDKATALKLDAKSPGTIKAAGGRYRSATLVAVPKDAAKGFNSEKEYLAAVVNGKVDGLVRAKQTFYSTKDVKEADPRKSVVEVYNLVKVDAKAIELQPVKAAQKNSPKNAPEEADEDEIAAEVAPKSRFFVSGIAAFLGIALAGLWLIRRWKS